MIVETDESSICVCKVENKGIQQGNSVAIWRPKNWGSQGCMSKYKFKGEEWGWGGDGVSPSQVWRLENWETSVRGQEKMAISTQAKDQFLPSSAVVQCEPSMDQMRHPCIAEGDLCSFYQFKCLFLFNLQSLTQSSFSLLSFIWPHPLNHCLPWLHFFSPHCCGWLVAKLCPALRDSWSAACQDSLSFTNSWNLLKLMDIDLVMPSNHLILCHPLLLLPSLFLSIRVFSHESVLRIRWPKDWGFSFSIVFPMSIQGWFPLGLITLISLQSV